MRLQPLRYIVSGLTITIAIAIFLFAARDRALALAPTADASNPSQPSSTNSTNSVNAVTQCTPTPGGLVAWWPLDGNVVEILNNNPTTPFGGFTFGAGKVAGGMDLNGTSGFFQSDTVPDLSSSFTFDLWVYWRGGTGTNQVILVRENGDGSESYSLQVDDTGKLTLLMAENSPHPFVRFLQGVLKKNAWSHLAVSFSAEDSVGGIFVNGAQLLRFGAERDFGTFPLSVGGFHGAQNFNGIIDEVEIFSRALNADEIHDIFSAGTFGKCRPCAPPPPQMTAWWPLDGDLTDIQGGFTGSASGGTNFATGEVGQAINLDGTNGSFTASNVPDPNAAFSFDAWVFWRGNAGTIVSRSGSYRLSTDSGGMLSLAIGSSVGTSASAALPLNAWSHVTVTYTGSQALTYVNGVPVINFNAGGRTFSATPLSFGSNQGTSFFNGLLDEVEIFSRALSSTEAVAIYGAATTGKCRQSPICYNGHAYALTKQAGTWDEAEAEAVNAGGHLVAVNTLFESDFLINNFLEGRYGFFNSHPLWIGLHNDSISANLSQPSAPSGDPFHWTNGDPVDFTFWDDSEPNFDGPAVALNWHAAQGDGINRGAWADLPSAGTGDGGATPPYFGIIEVPGCVGVPAAPKQPHPPKFIITGGAKRSTAEDRDVVLQINAADGQPIAHNTTVPFSVGGTAHVGSDYQVVVDDPDAVPGTLTFVAGEKSAFVTIHIQPDMVKEKKETVIFTLQGGPNYTLHKNHKVTITIVKNNT